MTVTLHRSAAVGIAALLVLSACGGQPNQTSTNETNSNAASTSEEITPLIVGSIPDQDPEKVQRLADSLATYLEAELEIPVEYQPVTDYAAAVTAFKVGDLDLVWFGGLTGVQARLQVDGAEAIAQRDIDEEFQSVFIANTGSGIDPFEDIEELTVLDERTFTFGSESSTSGRLMPQYFLQQAGMTLEDFQGEVGFSGNHDATIKLVEAGTYEAGALNSQVWEARLAEGAIDESQVQVVWWTPPYYDYHWVVSPESEELYGEGFTERLQSALTGLDPEVPEEKEILDLFGANEFIPTENDNYANIEAIGRQIGKIQ